MRPDLESALRRLEALRGLVTRVRGKNGFSTEIVDGEIGEANRILALDRPVMKTVERVVDNLEGMAQEFKPEGDADIGTGRSGRPSWRAGRGKRSP